MLTAHDWRELSVYFHLRLAAISARICDQLHKSIRQRPDDDLYTLAIHDNSLLREIANAELIKRNLTSHHKGANNMAGRPPT